MHDADDLADNIVQGQKWLDTYLNEDVENLQQMKQHHVHLLNVDTQVREPLAACRRKDKPNLCKADFPRMKWLVTKAVILCAKLLQKMDQKTSGRRCMLGAMHGPMNHPSINATHPAMLACHRCNSDVQLPYRFPIIPETHFCDDDTCLRNNDKVIVQIAQAAQDAQAGYACDYCTKRQPCAFNEVKECCKGHKDLSQRVRAAGACVNDIGKRHAMRLMGDAYGKGIVRGQVECTNLRAYHKDSDVTAAEAITTALTIKFAGVEFVNLVQRLDDHVLPDNTTVMAEVDTRHRKFRKVTLRDSAVLYGQRPRDPRVWYLSPYEFVKDWEVSMVSYPQSLKAASRCDHHVILTDEGKAKLEAQQVHFVDVELCAGMDYVVKEEGGESWLPYPAGPGTDHFRHIWIIKRRLCMHAPVFLGAPIPHRRLGEADRAAMITMSYFHPWTLRGTDEETGIVPYAGNLRPADATWEITLSMCLDLRAYSTVMESH